MTFSLVYELVQLLTLMWLFKFQLIEILIEEQTQEVDKVIKKRETNERCAKFVFYLFLFYIVLFIVFQTGFNLYEL